MGLPLQELQNMTEGFNLVEACTNHQNIPSIFGTFLQIFYALVCLVGLCGNTLVIYVVLRYSKMQTVTYIYILMLAIADEIFLLGIPFLITTMIQRNWVFGFHMCKIYYTTTSINQVHFNARAKRAIVANLQFGNISVYSTVTCFIQYINFLDFCAFQPNKSVPD